MTLTDHIASVKQITVSLTKRKRIMLKLSFWAASVLGLLLTGCVSRDSNSTCCAYEAQKRIRMLEPGNFTEEELIRICGRPAHVLKADEFYERLNARTGNVHDRENGAYRLIMDDYNMCKSYLEKHEPFYDDWSQSELFNQFDFYLYNEEITIETHSLLGRRKSGPHSFHYIISNSKVICTGSHPTLEDKDALE